MKTLPLVFVISITFCLLALVIGASAESIKYNTPDGTITFNLPDGYYMNVDDPFSADQAFVMDDGWALEAAKGEPKAYSLTISAYNVDTIEGAEADKAFAFKVNEAIEYNQNSIEGSYTKIASGQTAWISIGKGQIEGRYNAFIDLEADKSKLIQIRSVPQSDSTQPPAGMTTDEFKNFVESINIE